MTEDEKKFADSIDAKIAAREGYLRKVQAKVTSCDNHITMYQTKKQEYLDDIAEKSAALEQMKAYRDEAIAAEKELAELRPKLQALTKKLGEESTWMPGDDPSLLPMNNPKRIAMFNRMKELEAVTMKAAMNDVNRLFFGKG